MAGAMDTFGLKAIDVYNSFISIFPDYVKDFVILFLLVLIIVLYSVFIWKFYRFIARKNIIGLNLSKYNKSQHPFLEKLFAVILYFVEYIIILPFIIFFWFSVFAIFLILLTEGIDMKSILIITATIIASIRMVSYYNEDLSKDLSKLLPFTLLAITITKPGFFNIETILGHFSEFSGFFDKIVFYLIFIISLEIILRGFDFMISLFELRAPQLEEKSE